MPLLSPPSPPFAGHVAHRWNADAGNSKGTSRRAARLFALLLLLSCAAFGLVAWLLHGTHQVQALPADAASGAPFAAYSASSTAHSAHIGLLLSPAARGKTLVIYVYGGSDPEYITNFQYFVEEAVKADDGCEYIIVLQQGGGTVQPDPLPALPPNARYLLHPNRCLDIGTVGWVLENHVPHLGSFDYFMWANPSVRGPLLPAYLRGHMHWTEPFLSKLTPTVKLVGATINCGGIGQHAPAVHVQSYVAATDREGLAVLLNKSTVFHCWDNYMKTVVESEIGSSTAILQAGFGIDSLMLRYQGVDWRDPAVHRHACNGGRNPLAAGGMNDGVSIDPLEVMFVKVKSPMRAWPQAAAAIKLAQWTRLGDEQARRSSAGLPPTDAWLDSLAANAWRRPAQPELIPVLMRRPECFDVDYYFQSSADIAALLARKPDAADWAWKHFCKWGLWEGRPYRFSLC